MKWGQHIFGNDYKYKSLGQIHISNKLKRLGRKVDKKTNIEYRKLKNKYKKIKKRDAKGYEQFKKDQGIKSKQKINNKVDNKDIKKIRSISELSDDALAKQIKRLKSENEYYSLKQIHDQYKRNSSATSKVLSKIGKKILEPALTESSKTVVQDLLTKLGQTTNNSINSAYKKNLSELTDESNKKPLKLKKNK